jgi:hypothetical protein
MGFPSLQFFVGGAFQPREPNRHSPAQPHPKQIE